jgi:hyaluronoglucosaminidase
VGWNIRGIIEGFYGRPWSWDERVEVMQWCHARGMTHYVYAPKDDPLHRERWREPYGADDLAGFTRLRDAGGLAVGFALSPGLSIAYDDPGDRATLAAKVDQVVDLGITLICLALDDIPPRPGLGEDHAAVTRWLREHLDGRADLLLVPTEYTGVEATPYLDALATGVPDDVPIAWTGTTVVCDAITSDEASARAASLGGRPPLVWDNYPVNDALMGDHLYVGPLRGRAPGLVDVCSGYLANPMVQPRASMLPLTSVAAYLRGEDPAVAWEAEAETAGLRTFAEACDGVHPRRLVDALIAGSDDPGSDHWLDALDAVRAWLDAAARCEAPGLEGEVDRWLEQVHTEADVGLAAVRVLERIRPNRHRPDDAPDVAAAVERALMLTVLWQQVRRSDVSVFGDRLGIRPVLGQDDAGRWVFHRAAVTEDANAIDALVRFTLDTLADGR